MFDGRMRPISDRVATESRHFSRAKTSGAVLKPKPESRHLGIPRVTSRRRCPRPCDGGTLTLSYYGDNREPDRSRARYV